VRTLSEFVGRLTLWAGLLWVGAILVAPVDVRPAVACRPIVWLTRALADVASSAAGAERPGFDAGDATGSLSQGCMRVIVRYFDAGAARS